MLPWPTLLNLLLISTPAAALWPFPPKRFTKNSLLSAGHLGVADRERVVAFGDFNADQYMDLITLDPSQTVISLYLWNHESFSFLKNSTLTHKRPVSNIIPGDYTYDGLLDLLVMSPSSRANELEMTIYPAVPKGGFDTTKSITVPPSTLAQPIPYDANGLMRVDLLGTPSGSKDIKKWQNVYNASSSSNQVFSVVDPMLDGSHCTLADPHSNALVDLDGDCLADLFLLCDNGNGNKYYQIWTNKKKEGFKLSRTGTFPAGTQTVSFADMDRDGTIDMVFTTCSSMSSSTGLGSDCAINIAYNQQLPLCASDSSRQCRQPDGLCSSDANFKFDFTESPKNDAFVRIPTLNFDPKHPDLLVYDVSFTPPLPLPIKIGDVDLDGYSDIFFISGSSKHHVPMLFVSVPCSSGGIGCRSDGSSRRGFELLPKGGDALKGIHDTRSVSFLDLDEDGTLDMMIQRTGGDGKGNLLFVQNNIYYDAFFLKAIVLDGACDNGICAVPNSSERYLPLGVSYSGASYKYSVLDTTGRRSAAQVGQLPQTAYHALLTPYTFFGLGRTNNYIENLFVGSTKHSAQHYINMEGVIPNSKLVISPSAEGDEWKRQLFLRPGEWIPWVTVTVIVTTLILLIIVWILHLNEKREDELERRRASHHINFDAL